MEMFDEFYESFGFLQFLASIAAIVAFICWILVIVGAFQHGEAGWGIMLILTTVICGFGYLLTYIYGWMSAGQHRQTGVMLLWTACLAFYLLPFLYVVKIAS